MLEKIRQKLLEFIYSDKDYPVLAGFSIGLYVILFYYSKNFGLANSLIQLLFFIVYYIAIPIVVLFVGYKVIKMLKMTSYLRIFLFTGMLSFFAYYFLEINTIPHSRRILLGVVILSGLLAIKFKKYYKLFIILFFFISVFNIPPIAGYLIASMEGRSNWEKQPDGIEQAVFKNRPNIYYIQPDGYTNFTNLKDSIHNFDNNSFSAFLQANDFKVYDKQHSNYYSTLLSNSSMFAMKHHYITKDVEAYRARQVVIEDNAVLRTLKNNKYKTFFITEKPYFLMNRPDLGYDYCNIPSKDIPFIKDGWSLNYDVLGDLKKVMDQVDHSGNFFFIEKFTPGHISVFKNLSDDEVPAEIEKEKTAYLSAVKKANIWLREIIGHIEAKDPNAIIIIGADHGGFAGLAYSLQSQYKITDKNLVNSIFGSLLAIKWNEHQPTGYDSNLKSSVNLFRTVFSVLSQNKGYLNNLQDNSSYIKLTEPKGLYRYINDKGEVVFEKTENVQD